MPEKYEAEINELLRTLEGIKYAQEQVQSIVRRIDNVINNGMELKELKTWTEKIWTKRIDNELEDCQRRIERVKDCLIDKRNQAR